MALRPVDGSHEKPDDALPALPPRRQTLLRDPVAYYLDSLAPSSAAEMRGQLRRLARLVGYESTEQAPWENLRLPHYAEIARRLREHRPDPECEPERRLAPATVRLGIAALRGVAGAVWELGGMTAEEHARVAKGLKSPRGSRLPAGRSARRGEIAALMDACAGDPSPAGARDAAMIGLMYAVGLRRSEVAGLALSGYRPAEGELRVVGKGDRERAVPVVGGLRAALDDWVYERGDAQGPLFLRINKGARIQSLGLTDDAVYQCLRKRNRQAGLPEGLTPHDLRRTFITELWGRHAPGPVIQRLAGHASLVTTASYDRSGAEAEREAAELLHVPYRARHARAAGAMRGE